MISECTFKEFVSRLQRTDRKLICYGAGMLPYYVEPLFQKYGIDRRIACFVDGDVKKQGKYVHYACSKFRIESPEIMRKLNPDEYIILITAERYKSIFLCISGIIDNISRWECYAYPILNRSFFQENRGDMHLPNDIIRIPKIIHYIWFGEKEKSALHKKCISSWREILPDFEIIEWNEKSYNVNKNQYTSQAYERKKWAYVADFARLDILHTYGGVYFDTDVELKKQIHHLLCYEAFICFGEWPAPASGAGIGCVKGNGIIKEMMETRSVIPYIQKDGSDDAHTNSNYEEEILLRQGFQMDFSFQIRNGMAIYPPDVIAPVSVTGQKSYVTERTVGIHYGVNSWRKKDEVEPMQCKQAGKGDEE